MFEEKPKGTPPILRVPLKQDKPIRRARFFFFGQYSDRSLSWTPHRNEPNFMKVVQPSELYLVIKSPWFERLRTEATYSLHQEKREASLSAMLPGVLRRRTKWKGVSWEFIQDSLSFHRARSIKALCSACLKTLKPEQRNIQVN